MKKSTKAIILREAAADFGRVAAVLRGWGYQESEIRNFLAQQEAHYEPHERSEVKDLSASSIRQTYPD